MDNTCSKHFHAKIRPILTLFCLCSFIHQHAFTVADNSPFQGESIRLACGYPDNFQSLDGRSWTGDSNSPYFHSFEPDNNSSIVSYVTNQARSPEKYYLQARLSYSRFTYIFNVSAGQKFIRLYFYPTSYPGFDRSKSFFSVTAGSFTLLKNFSASLTADAYGDETYFKEFCINVGEDQRLNITLAPCVEGAYAFINGIEIVSMPTNLYYSAAGSQGPKFLGQENQLYSIRNSNALETVYRINIGGNSISPQYDTAGMYRTWLGRYMDYLTVARPGAVPANTSIVLKFSKIQNYTAPVTVYQSAMSMGNDKEINQNSSLTWEFPVDSGFQYFVRLHFCEFQIQINKLGDRVFEIDIANQTAEPHADIIGWTGQNGNGIPIYRDYAVLIGRKGNIKRQNLSIALHPAAQWRTVYSDAILNGLEIFKVDENGNLAGPNPDPLSLPSPSPQSTKSTNNHATLIGIIGGLASGFVVTSLLFLFICWRAKKVKDSGSSTGASFLGPCSFSTTKSTKSHGSSLPTDLCTRFSLSEIKTATNDFDDIFIIGVGGFGNVYKGYINNGVTPVAIKRLNPGSQQGALEFNTEIEMLSQLRHLHLVSLIGYCDDHGEMILVYDYMVHGTLRDHLYNTDNPPLSWNQRLEICIGAARGLHYLHTEAKHRIIHRDVKTTNILLDDKWVAKVSDFGLSKMGPTTMSKTHVSTVVKGSFGYLDPEYYRLQQLTEKSDVYSFGVVLFEVLCARPPIVQTENKKQGSLAFWAQQCYNNGTLEQIVDPILKGKIAPECLKKFSEIAMSCLNDNGTRRPSMSDVVWGLEFALQLQETSEIDKQGHEEDHRKKAPLVDEEMPLRNVDGASDIDSDVLFSSIGDHVLESRASISTVTLTTSDDQSFSAKSSNSKAIFSEIMNPQGR